MELTRKDTKMLQGLSVIAMVCLHLFNRDYHGIYEPLFFINNVPFSFCLSQLSDFCVFGFAFCSGYGHMIIYEKKDYFKNRLKSLSFLLINFWVILFGATLVSVMIGQCEFMPGTIWDFLGTFFLYNMKYNAAWWYLWAYVLLVLISPILLNAIKRFNTVLIVLLSFFIYCIAFYTRFYLSSNNYLLDHFGPWGMTLFEYVIGAVIAKIMFFTKISNLFIKVPSIIKCIISYLIILILLIARTFIIPNVFFAPFSGFIIVTIFALWKKPKWIVNIFTFLGKHSTNIWLTHMFFVSSLWIFFAKYPLLIFLLLLAITIIISIGVSFIMKLITKALNKVRK